MITGREYLTESQIQNIEERIDRNCSQSDDGMNANCSQVQEDSQNKTIETTPKTKPRHIIKLPIETDTGKAIVDVCVLDHIHGQNKCPSTNVAHEEIDTTSDESVPE